MARRRRRVVSHANPPRRPHAGYRTVSLYHEPAIIRERAIFNLIIEFDLRGWVSTGRAYKVPPDRVRICAPAERLPPHRWRRWFLRHLPERVPFPTLSIVFFL